MNNNIKENYRYTIKGRATIVDSSNGKFVLKEKLNDSNIKGLYSYLKSRDFFSFADVIDDSRKEVNVYEYLDDIMMPREQKAEDLISLVADLHSSTLYFKEVREDKFKEVYENVDSNINFLTNYNNNLYNRFFKEKYMAPSHYLFMKNFYKIESALKFCKDELDNWYDLVKDEKKMRVSIIHNDLSVDHYLKSEKDALISWEKHAVDTPVLDLVKLYQNDKFKYSFKEIFHMYNNKFPLNRHEKKLFFILISLPEKMLFDKTEFKNTVEIRKSLDYMFKTEELVKPYYSEYEKKEEENFAY